MYNFVNFGFIGISKLGTMVEKDHKRSVHDEQFGPDDKKAESTTDAVNENTNAPSEEQTSNPEMEAKQENVQENDENNEQTTDAGDDKIASDSTEPEDQDPAQERTVSEETENQKPDSNPPETKETLNAHAGDKSRTGENEIKGEVHSAEKNEGADDKTGAEEGPTSDKISSEQEKPDVPYEQPEKKEFVASSEPDKPGEDGIREAEETNTSGLVEEKKPEIPEAKEGEVRKELKATAAKTEKIEEEADSEKKDSKEEKEEEPADYTKLTKEQLVEELRKIIEERPVQEVKDEVDQIRFQFTKKHKAEIDQLRRRFLEQGGQPQDFKPEEDPLEKQLKAYIEQFREKRSAFNREQEENKQKNLEEKYRIIEEIKDLVNRKESLNKTFQEFRDLQARWREVGLVPQANVKDLWETYHHHVEKFYDYIKINKELRDLDLKKNLEAKIKLCEKAEELLLEPNIVNAFKTLQTYHDQWREIGPVPAEMRTEIWERFKEATSKINRKHQEYYDNLKQEQRNNLESKKLLCEKAEEIADMDINSYREWDQRSDEMKELQKIWKTIGFAPRKDNNKIYDRFRTACDRFFNNKREFYAKNREEQSNNLQLKTDLCIQAEALKDSTEWRKTTEDLIQLQKHWKQIGPVPKKYSDSIWKRFRAACDEFFNRKSEHFGNIDSKYEQNLNLKEQLIKDIESFTLSNDVEENLKQLKEFQRRWAEIGFVPIKKKDEIQQRYREAINTKFDKLKIDDTEKNIIKFKTKLDDLSTKPRSNYRLRQDRDKFVNKLKQLESDIVLWENNIGFFAKSKNADQMITEVEHKIKDAKEKMKVLQEKIELIETKLDED
jgi:hypothetical protein